MEWAKFQERERKKEEEEREKERVAYAQIDWHDFVVVETVDFQPNEQGRKTQHLNPAVWCVSTRAIGLGRCVLMDLIGLYVMSLTSSRTLPSAHHP